MVRIAGKISLPDAIIAATALHYNFELITNNESDFKGIAGLRIINPLRTITT
jgi:predicted nucleic acid-binding protein